MKYLKKYKIFESSGLLGSNKLFCLHNNITSYVINDDNSLTINQDAIIKNYMLFAEVDIREVNGNFTLEYFMGNTYNDLSNPDFFGCPNKVTGNFYLKYDNSSRRIKSLRGCPTDVGGNFEVTGTSISNLKYFPEYIGGRIDIGNNKIESLIDIKEFDNRLDCSGNVIFDLCGYKPKDFYNNPIYELISLLIRHISSSNVNVDNMAYELIERFDEFDVIDFDNVDSINLEKLFDFYDVDINTVKITNYLPIKSDADEFNNLKEYLFSRIKQIGYKIK